MSTEQAILAQEAKLLQALALDAQLEQQLIPVTEDQLTPGLVLFYKLGSTYGCHIIRERGQGYTYKPDTPIREDARHGLFTTLPN